MGLKFKMHLSPAIRSISLLVGFLLLSDGEKWWAYRCLFFKSQTLEMRRWKDTCQLSTFIIGWTRKIPSWHLKKLWSSNNPQVSQKYQRKTPNPSFFLAINLTWFSLCRDLTWPLGMCSHGICQEGQRTLENLGFQTAIAVAGWCFWRKFLRGFLEVLPPQTDLHTCMDMHRSYP